jgi:menaquinone-dependent protoporphyrinogen oxidase
MEVLVAYASQHGATRGIAERIADRLRAAGLGAELAPVAGAPDPSRFDACVIGSAVYTGRWREEARTYVRAWAPRLQERPVWLFSSGPLGDELVDDQGRDRRETAAPDEATALVAMAGARDHRVFFGALNPDDLSIVARTARLLPPMRNRLVEGDFRDWPEIEAWADGIVAYLEGATQRAPVGTGG